MQALIEALDEEEKEEEEEEEKLIGSRIELTVRLPDVTHQQDISNTLATAPEVFLKKKIGPKRFFFKKSLSHGKKIELTVRLPDVTH